MHAETWDILAANQKSFEFTGYPTDQLTGFNIRTLLPGYNLKSPQVEPTALSQKSKQPILLERSSFELVHANQNTIPASVKSYKLPQNKKRILVIFETEQTKKGSKPPIPPTEFWRMLETITIATNDPDLPSALRRIISASQSISGAEHILIYKMAEDQPVLKILASSKNTNAFPDQLSAQELISLSTTQIWKPGRRTQNIIQRHARQEKLGYAATSPLGEPHAIVGLIIFAGASAPDANLLPFIQYINGILSTLIERHTQRENIEKDFESFQIRINTANMIENRISDGLILLTNNLKIKRMNLAAETILGYNHQEVKDQFVSKILIGAESLNQALHNAQNSSSTFRLGDNISLYRRNGESFQAIVRIFPVLRGKTVEEILVLIQDLSEQEFIKKQAQQLEQRAFLGEVTATFAHEIRNPVHNISTGLQLMAFNLPNDDPKQQDINLMIQDCDRLAELIKSVLAFSKPVDYEMENFDIGQMLKQLLERLRGRISRAKVDFDLQIAADCPPVYGNMHALEQVINNLVSNALNAMDPDGGRLVIKTHHLTTPEGRQQVEISIADTGRGIPKEIQDRIFQPFFTTERKGTGLGLAVSKRILTAHKGTIRLTSFPGGTVFQVQLPASKEL
jgi:PAS domain S-box-containing protein